MSFKMVILPPIEGEHWPALIREAAPGAEVVLCRDLAEAVEAIADADAAFGTVPPEVLARAGRLRWIQAPMA
ncbi:MAG TPA: D-2-hydroxyacid dehydrogenase, partial [Armatimonadota bacterium]|nr:D-2-hydroxyacid dehydrogenase [Armatimonadota bacterium]